MSRDQESLVRIVFFNVREKLLLGSYIECRCGIIQYQDWSITQQGSGNGNPLFLTARDAETSLADDGFISFQKPHDKAVCLGMFGSLLNLLSVHLRFRVSNVGGYGVGEQEHILKNIGEFLSQGIQIILSDISPVHCDPAVADIMYTDQGFQKHAFSGTGTAHDTNLFSWRNI